MTGVEQTAATADPPARQLARFVVMSDAPSDVAALERHG